MSNKQTIVVLTPNSNYTGMSTNNYTYFLGIQYATAQRWQVPIPYYANATVASEYPESCPQICRNVGPFCPTSISESCLSLNLWTPIQLNNTKIPVVVFIHGGSFETGSNSLSVIDGPKAAISMHVVFITINYRLGIFGFPGSLDDSPANLGILDQQLALSWVRDNIEYFGGDVERMTLMGQSAGAMSAMIHLSQEPTNGWFINGILMSPPATPLRSVDQSQLDFSAVAMKLNCTTTIEPQNWEVIKQCMATKTIREVLDARENVSKDRNHNLAFVSTSLIPVVDGISIHQHPFIQYAISTKNINILIGTLSNETIRMVEMAAPVPITQSIVSTSSVYGDSNATVISNTYDIIGNTLKDDFRTNLSRALTDAFFQCPVKKYSIKASNSNSVFKYYWKLPWTGGSSDPLGNICNGWSCHSTDLVYFFNDPEKKAGINAASEFRNLIKSFVYNGVPNSSTTPINLDIDRYIGGESFPDTHGNCKLWNSMPYLFESNYAPPVLGNYTGVGSLALLLSLMFALSIFGLQVILLIYNKYSQLSLYSRIEKVERKRTIEKDISKQKSHRIIMSTLIDFTPNPLQLTIHNLSYSVETTNGSKAILANCSFVCKPGTMTALLGPSGAGKTTLLSLIAKRYTCPTAQESVFYGNEVLNNIHPKDIKKMVGFVAQYNAPYIGLTCREFPDHVNKNMLAKKVAYILEIMDLTSAADTVILDPSDNNGGISGGQRRKLSIAIALLKSPSVIFLDEPTSGLDAQSSLQVMTLISQLAQQGFTIIVTIHQPRQEIFSLFTHLVVLAHGQVLSHGEICNCVQYFNYLQSSDYSTSTADHILDIAGTLSADQVTKYKMVSYYKSPSVKSTRKVATEHPTEIFKQFRVINTRFWLVRPFYAKLSMLLITLAVSIILGLLQRRVEVDITSISLQIKGLTVACIGLSALKNINISFDYYSDRDFYNFDSINGTVAAPAFFIHRLLYETTNATLESGICALLTFFILDCQSSRSSLQTIVTLIIVYYNCIVSFYTLIYSTKLDSSNARSISFFAQAILAVTSGIWIKKGDTAVYDLLYWVQYVNPNYWVLSTMIRANLVGLGDCYLMIDNTCRARLGDIIIEQARIDDILPDTAIKSMLLIWIVLRIAQFALLYQDSFIDSLTRFRNSKLNLFSLP
ncbi:hypothetical protein HK103_006215 [Boothiomyces macroporosus]|uniref:ABC transporter domain-containing protein n=1 Tax=Boothiomyces macroporosus TaxID=261099 RepID=A0AAD5UH54_9FUNG|nr:hypothetical protein HK103_006215 [Boothiomyces macroporosus]